LRRLVIISGGAVGVAILVAVALLVYAYFRLSAIVAANQDRILARVSDALGRSVQVGKIEAQLGWGVSIEVDDLTIADDPTFSPQPFIAAHEAAMEVRFIPLLRGEVIVTKLDLIKPDISLVMNKAGALNTSTVGAARVANEKAIEAGHPQRANRRSFFGDLSIHALSIEDGALAFTDLGERTAPISVSQFALTVNNFDAATAFEIALKFAFTSSNQNVVISGKLGPLLEQGIFDENRIPIDLKFDVDSLLLDHLRALDFIGSNIPAALSIPDPLAVAGTAKGTPRKLDITVNTDLTNNRILYGELFNKPAGTTMALAAGATMAEHLQIGTANLKLADLALTASDFSSLAAPQISEKIDSNSFNLATIVPMVPAAATYAIGGISEVHGVATIGGNGFPFDGTIALKQVSMKPGPPLPGTISDLSGTVQVTKGQEVIEPTTLTLGSSHMKLQGQVESVSPLNASYSLSADSLRLAQIVADRPPSDILNQLAVRGTATGEIAAPRISAEIQSTNGSLQNVSYSNLDLTAAYSGSHVVAHPLKVGVFGGSLSADGSLELGKVPQFSGTLVMNSLDIEQALRSQNLKAAKTVRGLLTGNVAASGRGKNWDQIKPTLSGSGRVAIANGKLIGVNIVADAINAVAAAPGVSQIVDVAFMSSHHGLLVDPNTELESSSMTFQLTGPRFSTNDLYAQSPDYVITSTGWFDMDENIRMSADIQLTLGLRVALPVYVTGHVPEVLVLPNLPKLTERIAMGAIHTPANIIRGGINAVGSLVGRGSSSGDSSSGGSSLPSIPNPINALKKFLP
jgi:uncharacterized protein involved in outer membrane biogenesis